MEMAQTGKKQTARGGGAAASKGASRPIFIAVVALAVIVTAFIVIRGGGSAGGEPALVKDADIVIPIADVSSTARFYPAEVDGTRLEVVAVKAPDGTVRTAFNTCQVCYDSGRGYYKQSGDVLVCQNCGNRFGMDQVEVQSGGCNPVPIFPENKTVTDTTITISAEFLTRASVIFANWRVYSD
jgi:uncharacterized membrane protein